MFPVVVLGTSNCPAGSGPGKRGLTPGREYSKGALNFTNFCVILVEGKP